MSSPKLTVLPRDLLPQDRITFLLRQRIKPISNGVEKIITDRVTTRSAAGAGWLRLLLLELKKDETTDSGEIRRKKKRVSLSLICNFFSRVKR